MARPRKDNVHRDKNGKSRGEFIHPESIAVRERQLEQDGIVLQFRRYEGLRQVTRHTATDRLAGSSLGRLYLRWQQGERINSISKEQFENGEQFGNLIRRYTALIFSRSQDHPKSSSWELGGGRSCAAEPSDEEIAVLKEKVKYCSYLLKEADQGRDGYRGRIAQVTFGICVQDWEISRLMWDDFGKLRLGLNAVGKALDTRY